MIESLGANGKKSARPARPAPAAASGRKGKKPKPAALAKAREPILEAQIQAAASVAGSLAAQQANLQNAGACLEEPVNFSAATNGLHGLDTDLTNLFDSFQLLADDPHNVPMRHNIVQSAQAVAVQLNHAASRLNAVRIDLNASIQGGVDRANQHLDDIASLNRQILEGRPEAGGMAALIDGREQSLEALSAFISISVGCRPDGALRVGIGGVTMVSGPVVSDVLTTYRDKNGNRRIQAQEAGKRLKPAGGSIAGKITARDGSLAELQRGLDNLAKQLITRVNSIYKSAQATGGAGLDFFTGAAASDIGVNKIVAGDPSQLQAVLGRDTAVAQDLAQLGHCPVSALGNRTFSQWYAGAIAALGDAISNVNDNLVSSQAVAQMLANERGAESDVSMHDAANDLMWYQQARGASAKTIALLDKMSPMD